MTEAEMTEAEYRAHDIAMKYSKENYDAPERDLFLKAFNEWKRCLNFDSNYPDFPQYILEACFRSGIAFAVLNKIQDNTTTNGEAST